MHDVNYYNAICYKLYEGTKIYLSNIPFKMGLSKWWKHTKGEPLLFKKDDVSQVS